MAIITGETVIEHIKKSHYTKLWLCPSLVSDGRIGGDPLLRGIECTPSSVPKELYDKKVRTVYNDCGTHCIVWVNDDDRPFATFDGMIS